MSEKYIHEDCYNQEIEKSLQSGDPKPIKNNHQIVSLSKRTPRPKRNFVPSGIYRCLFCGRIFADNENYDKVMKIVMKLELNVFER